MPGPSEWIIVAVVAIAVIFGAKKLPEIARSVGRSQGEFKKGLKEGNVETDRAPDPETQPEAQPETAGTTSEQPKNPSTPPPASLN